MESDKDINNKELLRFLLSIFAISEWQKDLNKILDEVLKDE